MKWLKKKIENYNQKVKLEEFNALDVRRKQERQRDKALIESQLNPLLAKIDEASNDYATKSYEYDGILASYIIHQLYVRGFEVSFESNKSIISWN